MSELRIDSDGLAWHKASRSGSADNCVEVAFVDGKFLLRDSNDREGGVLTFTPHEFEAFAHGVRAGDFDHLRSFG